MNFDKFEYDKKMFQDLLFDGYEAAEKSHDLIFKDRVDIALAYLQQAHSLFTNAELFYHMNPDFQRNEFDTLFSKFNFYNREFMNNVATNHSHQWTDIQFRDLEESFNDIKPLFVE